MSPGVVERARRAGNVVPESDVECLLRGDATGGTEEGKAIRSEVGDGGRDMGKDDMPGDDVLSDIMGC